MGKERTEPQTPPARVIRHRFTGYKVVHNRVDDWQAGEIIPADRLSGDQIERLLSLGAIAECFDREEAPAE